MLAQRGDGVAVRLLALALLLAAELAAASIWFDGSLGRTSVAVWLKGSSLSPGRAVQGLVAFSVFALVFCGASRPGEGRTAAKLPGMHLGLLGGHVACLGGLWWLSLVLLGQAPGEPVSHGLSTLYLAGALGAVVSAALAFLPWGAWKSLLGGRTDVLLFALGAAVSAVVVGMLAELLWEPVTALTFEGVRGLLGVLVGGVQCDEAKRLLGTERFMVRVGARCSGLEGVGLMLAFTTTWLWFYRREYRFPRALILIPAGALLIWLFNLLRIAALILIGHAGAERIAVGGFHSQAGWIAFLAVALGTVEASRWVGWIRAKGSHEERGHSSSGGATATEYHLMPFLAVLAAGMAARAVSGEMEWLYPLRLIAAVCVLWVYRRYYRTMNWRPSWYGAAAGVAVFGLWIGLERMWPGGGATTLGAALAGVTPAARWAWLAARVAAAAITVPVAEELAFRGYLLRRLTAAEFEGVDGRRVTVAAVLISSAAFGILHGDRWVAGTAAGLVFALVYRRRGSVGDAALAHGVTNALLAGWVLATGQWQYW